MIQVTTTAALLLCLVFGVDSSIARPSDSIGVHAVHVEKNSPDEGQPTSSSAAANSAFGEKVLDQSYRPWASLIVGCQLLLTVSLILARCWAGSDPSKAASADSITEPDIPRHTRLARNVLEVGKHLVFPVFLFGSIIAFGSYPSIFVAFAALLMSVVLEHVIPYKPEWNQLGRQELNDLLHLFFSSFPGETIARMFAFAVVPTIAAMFWVYPNNVWPSGISFPLQVILAVVLFEACNYSTHYLSHRWRWLWNFHRLHHTSERITISKGFRRNIQEAFVDVGVSLTVALVCGIPQDVLQGLVGFQLASTIFAHANIDMYVPPIFQRIFITPSAHRIHHSKDLRYGNSNFGNTLMIFDSLFGTYTDPNGHVLGETGVKNNSVPPSFVKQWLLPFYWRKLDKNPVKQDGWK